VLAGAAVRAERHLAAGGDARRARPRAAPGLAALALVALVAALSEGLPDRVRGGGAGLSAQALLGDAAAVILVLALAGLAYMAYSEWTGRERRTAARARRRRRLRLPRPTVDPQLLVVPLLLAALGALLLALVALLGSSGTPHGALRTPVSAAAAPLRRASRADAAGGGSVPLDPAVLIAAAAVVAIAGGWFALRARRRAAADAPGEAQDALVAAVDDSLEDLAHEPDPRRAVIKAYDRMERALAASGAARERAETPLEYLRRALSAVRASQASIRRLTDLFEQARFSAHTIDAAMKGEAIAALSALRAELDGAGATGGTA
jgi:hypothetical protein